MYKFLAYLVFILVTSHRYPIEPFHFRWPCVTLKGWSVWAEFWNGPLHIGQQRGLRKEDPPPRRPRIPIPVCFFGCTGQHPQIACWSHQVRTWWSIGRRRRYLANSTEAPSQRAQTVYDDAECAKLVSTFCQFFAEKVNRIRYSISDAIASSACRMFVVRRHQGAELSSFHPVTVDEVRRLLSYAIEYIAARRTDVYAAEVVRWYLRTSHRHTC